MSDSHEVHEKEVLIDTTVQEKNITFPTDSKLHRKIIEGCRKMSEKEGTKLRQSYKRTLKQLMIEQRYREHPKKRYEFDNKSSFVITKKSGIVAGTIAFEDNIDDGHTLEPQFDQVEDLLGRLPETA